MPADTGRWWRVPDDDATATGPTRGFSPRALAVIVTLAFGLILLIEVFVAPPSTFGGVDNPGAWKPPRDRAELLVAKMDGHTFAQIADDPLMRETIDAYHGDETNAAYRSSRPVMGWLAFVASAGGQRPLLAPALIVLTALIAGAVVLATDLLGRTLGLRVRHLELVALTPALVAAVSYPGISDPLACVLALLGLAAWTRSRTALAVALFCVAALTRETTILVPAGVAIDHLLRTRKLRPVLPLTIVPAAYLAWVGVVYARIGALPSSYSPMDGVLVGFRQAAPHWKTAEWLTALVLVVSAALIVRAGPGWMRITLALHGIFFLFMNYQVWWVWWGFGRVGTVLPIFGLISLARLRAERADPTGDGSAPPVDLDRSPAGPLAPTP